MKTKKPSKKKIQKSSSSLWSRETSQKREELGKKRGKIREKRNVPILINFPRELLESCFRFQYHGWWFASCAFSLSTTTTTTTTNTTRPDCDDAAVFSLSASKPFDSVLFIRSFATYLARRIFLLDIVFPLLFFLFLSRLVVVVSKLPISTTPMNLSKHFFSYFHFTLLSLSK